MANHTPQTDSTVPANGHKKLPFLKGRVFELVLCVVSLVAVVVAALQVPLGSDASTNQSTTLVLTALSIIGVASALMIRHGVIASVKRDVTDPHHGNPIYRWLFFWALIPAALVVLLPWTLSGVFSDNEVNALGAMGLFTLLGALAVLCGVIVAAVVIYPIETLVRGIIVLAKTRGKEGLGRVVIGGYLMLFIGFIIFGSLSVAAILPGQAGHGALIAALFGIPGGYTVKDASFLWPTRVFGILIIMLPILYELLRKKYPDAPIIREITGKVR